MFEGMNEENRENRSFIKKITLSGYKSISRQTPQSISLCKDVNVLIGANGAGKSNFISFFKMLGYMMTGSFQTYVAKSGFANRILYMGAKCTPIMEASIVFAKDDFPDDDTYNFSLVKSVEDTLIFSEESIECWGQKQPLGGGRKESYLITNDTKNKPEKIVKTILSKCRTFQFHDTSETSNIKDNCPIVNNHYLFSDAGNVAAILYLLKTKYEKDYKRIVQFVTSVFPQFEDFDLSPQRENDKYMKLNWKQKDTLDYIFGPEQLSDGSIRFIALASLLLSPPDLLPNVIVIDEPELGLHPQAINALVAMVQLASRYSQIILATQSTRILDSFEANQIIVVEMNNATQESVFRHLDETELKSWMEDYSLSQLWEKNVLGGQP